MTNCTKPCSACPFSRASEPGALGGSDVPTYIGQAAGPFLLACHQAKGYHPATVDMNSVQCGGAAIFRANTEVAELMPAGVHTLPPDHEAVFSTNAELLAHHAQIPLDQAEEVLSVATPAKLMQVQMDRLNTRRLK